MRILFVSSGSSSFGGGEFFLVYLAMALQGEGHELALWVSSHPRMDKLCAAFAPFGDVIRSNYRNTYEHWHRGLLSSTLSTKERRRILSEWHNWKPDLIHFNKQCLEDGLDLIETAPSLAVPHLVTIHITQPAKYLGSKFSLLRDLNARKALRKYTGIFVTVAESRAEGLRSFLDHEGLQIVTVRNGIPVVPPCLDRSALRQKEHIPDGLAVVGVGRLNPQKRPLVFIREIRRMREAGVSVYGRWIGDGGEARNWDLEVERYAMQGCLTRDGWRDDVTTVLPAFDLLLHTAAYEGLPFVLLEAMQAGLPCLVAKDVHDQLPQNLKACCLAFDENLDWKELLSKREHLSTLAKQGQSLVLSEFTNHAMAESYMVLYRRMTGIDRV